MQPFQFEKKKEATKYIRLSLEEKTFVNDRVIELRGNGVRKSYSECINIVLEKWNIELRQFEIYDIVQQYENKATKKKKKVVSYKSASPEVKNRLLQKMLELKRLKARMHMQVFADEVVDDFGIQLERDDIEDLIQQSLASDACSSEGSEEPIHMIKKTKMTIDGKDIEIDYEIHNVVFHGNLFPENKYLSKENGKKIHIQDFMNANPDAKYNPDRFPGIVIKIDPFSSSSKATILLFESGSFVTVGLRDVEKIEQVKRNLARRINRAGMNVKVDGIESNVCNIVLTTKIPDNDRRALDLNALTLSLDYCMYEPEIFPGLIHKPQQDIDGKKEQLSSFLIFSTKNVVCVGVRDFDRIPCILERFISSIRALGDSVYINDEVSNVTDDMRFLDLS